jgi:hypothetical protein
MNNLFEGRTHARGSEKCIKDIHRDTHSIANDRIIAGETTAPSKGCHTSRAAAAANPAKPVPDPSSMQSVTDRSHEGTWYVSSGRPSNPIGGLGLEVTVGVSCQ